MPKFHSRSYLRWSFVALWRAVLLGSLACTAFPKSVIDPEALGIAVGVEQRQVGDEWHPVAVVSIQNVSPHRIAFTKTFGITNQSWMSFAIEASDGSTVYYPSEVDVFTARPKYFCLQPGEVLVWELDLLSWDHCCPKQLGRPLVEPEEWGSRGRIWRESGLRSPWFSTAAVQDGLDQHTLVQNTV